MYSIQAILCGWDCACRARRTPPLRVVLIGEAEDDAADDRAREKAERLEAASDEQRHYLVSKRTKSIRQPRQNLITIQPAM